MQRDGSFRNLSIHMAVAALFIWITSRALPERVASHFDASGAPNGFMSHMFYVCFILAIVVALPLISAFATRAALNKSDARINVPNADYWLTSERRPETLAFIHRQLAHFWSILIVLLCYVHWLVVQANAVAPPSLSTSWLFAGLAVFLISVAVWMAIFIAHFRNIPC